MTAQGLFANIFSERDPQFNAGENSLRIEKMNISFYFHTSS